MAAEDHVWMALIVTMLLQLMGLTISVFQDSYIQKKHRRVMTLIIIAETCLVLQNYVEAVLDVQPERTLARTLAGIAGYTLRPVILFLFLHVVSKKRHHYFSLVMVGINAVIYMTALFSHVCFWIEDGHFYRGPLGFTCHIISAILLMIFVYQTFFEYSTKEGLWIPICNALLVVVSVILDYKFGSFMYPVAFLTIAVVTSTLFYYIWLHQQFVKAHERALVEEQKIQIMISQIQPHFLYNTLATIQALCRTDPAKAFDTTELFGTYLRQNLDSLNQPNLIPIEKELEHTRVYAEIENVRFPSVHVEYDVKDLNFCIPALTIQPLVENAIKHGVRSEKHGEVLVSVQKKQKYHEITVRDNGRGFDVDKLENGAEEKSDNAHIGIRNVRERIEMMCGGELFVKSTVGKGTMITVRIPE